jgi:hypothetical protein
MAQVAVRRHRPLLGEMGDVPELALRATSEERDPGKECLLGVVVHLRHRLTPSGTCSSGSTIRVFAHPGSPCHAEPVGGLNLHQRVVVSIGLGVGLWFVGVRATSSSAAFGWVGDAPLARGASAPGAGLHPWVRLVVWLALVAAWTGASLWLLRSREGAR